MFAYDVSDLTAESDGTGTSEGGDLGTPEGAATPEGGDSEPPEGASALEAADSFVIYHDPDAGASSVNRYNQAIALLDGAGLAYTEVTGDVDGDASRLAGVTNSVMPRFFFGVPTASD